jgi:phospholipid/cholesterol/gamma-HCH transport system substrate-binding protein
LLGEQYIGIEPGAEEKNLQAGDTVTATQSAVVLENLISQFLYSKAADAGAGGNGGGSGAAKPAEGSGSK